MVPLLCLAAVSLCLCLFLLSASIRMLADAWNEVSTTQPAGEPVDADLDLSRFVPISSPSDIADFAFDDDVGGDEGDPLGYDRASALSIEEILHAEPSRGKA